MRRFLISTAVAGVLAFAGAAMAQDDHHDQGGHPPAGGGAHPAPEHAAPSHAAPAHAAPAGGGDHRAGMDMHSTAGQQSAPHDQPAAHDAMRGPAMNMRGPGPAMAMHGPAPGGAHNFAAYNRNVTAAHRFHAPAYHRPHGWYAHRWTFGETLPALFWTQDLWINDFADFGLAPPPPGAVWVRDGNDALLIDQGSGEIIQVDYSVFY